MNFTCKAIFVGFIPRTHYWKNITLQNSLREEIRIVMGAGVYMTVSVDQVSTVAIIIGEHILVPNQSGSSLDCSHVEYGGNLFYNIPKKKSLVHHLCLISWLIR